MVARVITRGADDVGLLWKSNERDCDNGIMVVELGMSCLWPACRKMVARKITFRLRVSTLEVGDLQS